MGEEKSESSQSLLKPESILEGPFWPERVRVISSRPIGSGMEVRAVGLKPPERYYSRILRKSDLAKVRMVELRRKDFSGDAEAFFLAMEGKRIRFAYPAQKGRKFC